MIIVDHVKLSRNPASLGEKTGMLHHFLSESAHRYYSIFSRDLAIRNQVDTFLNFTYYNGYCYVSMSGPGLRIKTYIMPSSIFDSNLYVFRECLRFECSLKDCSIYNRYEGQLVSLMKGSARNWKLGF